MIPIIWGLTGGVSGSLRLIAGAVGAFALFVLWNVAIDNPRVRNDARQAYVAIALLEAEQAKSAELERQRNAGAIAFEEYRKRLAAVELADKADDARHEAEIAKYEQKLAEAGRSCALDSSDVDWLQQP